MLTAERRNKIIQLLKEKNSVTIHDLSQLFDVSLMTINRDLRTLEKEGKLMAVRGGAIKKSDHISESLFSQRINSNIEIKQILADKASKYVNEGDSIILDSSTTSIILCRKLISENYNNLTIVTNSNTIINELIPLQNYTVLSTGGSMLRKFHCLVGPLAELLVSQLRVDKFFFSVAGISNEGVLTDTDIQEVNIKKKMFEVANEKILLAGDHKFNKVALHKITDIQSLDLMITNSDLQNSTFIDQMKNKGVNIE